MKETRNIEVVPYNPAWPKQFEEEASLIQKALEENCIAVHHVGSTAVPGLSAKPKIDILLVVRTPSKEMIKKLEEIGFSYRGEYNIPMHYGFSKRGQIEVNLHAYQEGHPEIELNLLFRDYLRNHPEIRKEYGALKQSLLQEKTSYEKNNSMFTGYNLGKDAFIRKVLKLAGFDRLRFLKCTHYEELAAAKKLRNRYFPEKDAGEWTFQDPNHVHFVLCKGVDIIGYAHIRLKPSFLETFIVDEAVQDQGFDKQFLYWIEVWLKERG